jgi:hypothetical protein
MLGPDASAHPAHPTSPPGLDDVLYVACGQTGLAVEPSDFLLAIDLRDGVEHRAVGELHFDAAGEEIRSVQWLDEARSKLLVLGTGSSQLYVVDVATEPERPRLQTVITTQALAKATGCGRPAKAVSLPGARLLIVMGNGGGSAHGGLAVCTGGELELLHTAADAPPGKILDVAVCASADCAVAICGPSEPAGPHVLYMWDLRTGELNDRCDVPASSHAIAGSPVGEPTGGFLAGTDGRLLRWEARDGRLHVEETALNDPGTTAGRAQSVIELVMSHDGRLLYAGDWLGGTLSSFLVEPGGGLRAVDRLSLGGRDGIAGDAEGTRWDEMIRRGGRAALAGPANLTLTTDSRSLMVTNGAWADRERDLYPTFCSWLMAVECDEDGSLRVDRDRIMTVINRPAGPARYGQARTSWNRPPR